MKKLLKSEICRSHALFMGPTDVLKKGLKLKITKRLKILEDSQPSKIQHTDCKKAKEKLEKLGKVTISLRLTPT